MDAFTRWYNLHDHNYAKRDDNARDLARAAFLAGMECAADMLVSYGEHQATGCLRSEIDRISTSRECPPDKK